MVRVLTVFKVFAIGQSICVLLSTNAGLGQFIHNLSTIKVDEALKVYPIAALFNLEVDLHS